MNNTEQFVNYMIDRHGREVVDKAHEIVGVVQRQSHRRITYLTNTLSNIKKEWNGELLIPRDNFLHFKADSSNGKGEVFPHYLMSMIRGVIINAIKT